jgi:hypothetical protein
MFWRLQHLRQKDMRRSAMLKLLLAATVIAILLGLPSASAQPGYYGQPRFYDYGQYGVHAMAAAMALAIVMAAATAMAIRWWCRE